MANHKGFTHIAFEVEDVDGTTKIMEAEGFPCLQGGVYFDSVYAYYDTRRPLKILWEAYRPPSTPLPFKFSIRRLDIFSVLPCIEI